MYLPKLLCDGICVMQGIVRDSPKFDSSFDRGRTLKAKYKRAQLSLGLEEALEDMKPGSVKMVFLVPELSIACPRVRLPDKNENTLASMCKHAFPMSWTRITAHACMCAA
jgi:hypothetical protein